MDSLLFNIHPIILCLACLLLLISFRRESAWLSLIGISLLGIEVLRTAHFSSYGLLHSSLDLVGVAMILFITLLITRFSESKFVWIIGISGLWFIHSALNKSIDSREEDTFQSDLLVQFKDKASATAWLMEYGEEWTIKFPLFDVEDDSFLLDEYAGLAVEGDTDINALIEKLQAFEEVVHVEYNEVLEFKMPQESNIDVLKSNKGTNDPFLGKQWASKEYDFNKIHKLVDEKMAAFFKRKATTIAILDTGVDASHEDLQANYTSIDKKYDDDPKGHGTHCAGIAAAVSGNKIGIASLLPPKTKIKVTSVRVLGAFGGGTQKSVIDGIIRAADAGCAVISMSLGARTSDKKEKAYAEAVKYANDKGAIVVVAAGNSNRDALTYSPANTKGVITVAAVDTTMKKASFSNDISKIEMGISAPGTGIFSTFPGDQYKAFDGTSMSAPFIAGLIGLMKNYDKDLTTEQAYKIIRSTAIKKNNLNIVNPSEAIELFLSQ